MSPDVEVYQLQVRMREVHPRIWRRLLVRSDSTLADLHFTLQIALGWTDTHLHCFHLRGQDYGLPRSGGISFSTEAHRVRLGDFQFHPNERLRYEYDFGAGWELELRIERTLPIAAQKTYPVCIGGRRAAPPEECGGPDAYRTLIDHHRWNPPFEDLAYLGEAVSRMLAALEDESVRSAVGDLADLREALDRVANYADFQPDQFDRRQVNRRLQQYATGDEPWPWE
jgi:hypothetical protein